MTAEFWALIIIIALAFAAMSANLAQEKGYGAATGLLGFFLGPIGLMYAMGLPDKKARPTQKS